MHPRTVVLAALALVALAPAPAHAFCGFYIDAGGKKLTNEATQVVLMRKGTRTVLSMRNAYKGPVEDFAMVVPVPVVLAEADVKTLTADVFDRVDVMGAPRLVEYWEQDPCGGGYGYGRGSGRGAAKMAAGSAPGSATAADLGVTVEAEFTVAEYQIVILSAKESTGLDTWLRQERYKLPDGAEPALRPYVEAGSKFFVAKVDPKKVTFHDGRAMLSPLRFHYDSERFDLPIRLGLINASGKQDLIVNILAPGQRYEVANYKNVTIPTNIEVKDEVRTKFPEFYAALFDKTLEKHPGAVVTEYAWDASTCDPCPGPVLDWNDFAILGADVLDGAAAPAKGRGRGRSAGFVLTRLHARYGAKDMKDDLVFRAAEPIVGGREHVVDAKTGKLEEGATPDSINNFQGRYIIRHPWKGKIACKHPQRGIWGGPPDADHLASGRPTAAQNLAFARRGKLKLTNVIKQKIPELGLKPYKKPKPKPAPKQVSPPVEAPVKKGAAVGGVVLLVAGAALAWRRRRRRG